jgi:tetratricopeptide (TPR) repeat protein
MMLIGFVAGLVLGIGAMLIFGGESETSASNQTKQESTEEKQENASTLEEAITYLDKTEKWNRDEMEGFEELAGLWDALNKYRFDKIREYDLSKSENFTKLLEVIKGKNNLDKTRCAEGDFDISIAHYIKSLTSTPKTLSNPTNAKATPEQKNPESRNTIRSRNVEG